MAKYTDEEVLSNLTELGYELTLLNFDEYAIMEDYRFNPNDGFWYDREDFNNL